MESFLIKAGKQVMVSLLFAGCCILSLPAQQQSIRGNVVEYFGRERVEQTNEGTIAHTFTTGFMLPMASRGGALFNGQDLVAWQLAKGKFKIPEDGQTLADQYPPVTVAEETLARMRRFDPNYDPNKPLQWKAIQADTISRFTGPALRSAYIYTAYTSAKEQVVLLDAAGHTRVYINGMPHEGDHYDFAYTLIPFKLKKGLNEFIYTNGRFGRLTSKLVIPSKPVMFTARDMTLPDIITGETDEKWAAIRVINASEKEVKGMTVTCRLSSGEQAAWHTGSIMPLHVRKISFKVPASSSVATGKVPATLILKDAQGKVIDTIEIELQRRHATEHHERTFISKVDGSVQYFSVAPSTTSGKNQALVLSVHGAGVEAKGQARAYSKKDWTNLVAATNRRPYGFNWEVWGCIDGMEVLAEAKRLFEPDPSRIYLTGHSMGGHGTWYLGVTYPDHFAAIAPCASYPDIIGYSQLNGDRMHETEPQYEMFKRGANTGRTLELKRNYLQLGVYILHGDADRTVLPDQARMMRRTLGEFHPDFCYYEYPGGEHWFGNHSVDWPPIFDYFKLHSIPANQEKNHIEFHTASPGVSASNYWVRIDRQIHSYQFSNVVFDHAKDTIKGTTDNVQGLTLFLSTLELKNTPVLIVDDQQIIVDAPAKDIYLTKNQGKWTVVAEVNTSEKYAARYGGFKSAFENRMVFVYATGGNREENEWYRNKACFDAETFLYRGNGSVEVIADKDFSPKAYPDNNIVVYGNATNHKAWNLLLSHSPVQVSREEVRFGGQVLKGNDLAAYFIYPRNDCPTASVGVVAGTGNEGMKATFANNYISGITGFPDLMIFNTDMLKDGLKGVKISGFFGYDWSIEKGDFIK